MSLRCVYRPRAYDFFQICHCAELNKIVGATMPVNPYDDRKVSLRRPHGNGDLDIGGSSYTRRKANVTEALVKSAYQKFNFLISKPKHMLWVLKRTVSMRRFFWAPKTFVKIDG